MSPAEPSDGGVYVRKAEGWDSDGWTSVPNRALRDPELSWEAKGALGWLASHRERYRVTADDLAAAGPKGRENARGMIRELEAKGWLTRTKVRDDRNVILYHDWTLHARPVAEAERTTPAPHPSKGTRRADVTPPVPGILGTGADQQKHTDVTEPVGSPEPEENRRSEPVPGILGPGGPVTGAPVTGAPVTSKKSSREDQEKIPQPPLRGGDRSATTTTTTTAAAERCTAHGRASCRPCGTSPRAAEQAAQRAAVLEGHEHRVAVTLENRQDRAVRRQAAAGAGLSAREAIRRQLQERRSAG